MTQKMIYITALPPQLHRRHASTWNGSPILLADKSSQHLLQGPLLTTVATTPHIHYLRVKMTSVHTFASNQAELGSEHRLDSHVA